MDTGSFALPIQRDPYGYVQPGFTAEKVVPMAPNQGLVGIRVAEGLMVRPIDAPPAHPKRVDVYNMQLPINTCAGADKLYDPDIKFPRGDSGDMSLPPVPKLDGNAWASQVRGMQVTEVGTSAKCALRAFRSPRTNAILYQGTPPNGIPEKR